jgi:hypothetical protein
MEFKEIDGKRYILFNNVFIVLITLAISLVIGLFIFISFFVHHYNAIYSDPLNWGVRTYNLSQCECIAGENTKLYFNESKVWYTPTVKEQSYPIWNINLTG